MAKRKYKAQEIINKLRVEEMMIDLVIRGRF